MIVCDTGPIVAAALDDAHHHECVELFTGLHLAGRPLLVPGTVVAEVGYLLARDAGPCVEALFFHANENCCCRVVRSESDIPPSVLRRLLT